MKQSKFKKLALMGVVGGALLAQSSVGAAVVVNNMNLAGHSCGSGSCGAKTQPSPSQGSCAGSKNGCANKASGCANKTTHSCANKTNANGCGNKSGGRGYTADATTEMKDATARRIWTESELLNNNHLSESGKAAYRNLTPEGKALALKLASTDQYKDKNDAVKEAERQTAGSNKNSTMNKNY